MFIQMCTYGQHLIHATHHCSISNRQCREQQHFTVQEHCLAASSVDVLWLMQEEQVEYLDDSEVDFSSDDDDEDMEDFEGGDDDRLAAGQSQLGKRQAGTEYLHVSVQCPCAACSTLDRLS